MDIINEYLTVLKENVWSLFINFFLHNILSEDVDINSQNESCVKTEKITDTFVDYKEAVDLHALFAILWSHESYKW